VTTSNKETIVLSPVPGIVSNPRIASARANYTGRSLSTHGRWRRLLVISGRPLLSALIKNANNSARLRWLVSFRRARSFYNYTCHTLRKLRCSSISAAPGYRAANDRKLRTGPLAHAPRWPDQHQRARAKGGGNAIIRSRRVWRFVASPRSSLSRVRARLLGVLHGRIDPVRSAQW